MLVSQVENRQAVPIAGQLLLCSFATLPLCKRDPYVCVCVPSHRCAGVILDTRNPVDLPKTCRLLKGDGTLGTFIRTVTRTDVTRLGAQGLF